VPRTATPTCTIHCIFRVPRLLFVYLRTPQISLTSVPVAHFPHTHIAESPTTFSVNCWAVPSFRWQDAVCHRGGPVSCPGHTVRVFRWTEWHWDRFLFSLSCSNLPSFWRQDAVCHRGGPVSGPGHTVRVFRWTEWHWDRFLFSLTCLNLPSFRRQDAVCHRGGPVSGPGHTVRVFRWTEWHWDRFFPAAFRQCSVLTLQ